MDNALSISSGREVYGWAKKGMHIECDPSDPRPNVPHRLFSLYLETSSTASGSDRKDYRTAPFIEVSQSRPFMSGRGTPAEFIKSLPRTLSASVEGALGLLELAGVPPFGFQSQGLSSLLPLLQRLFGLADTLGPNVTNLLGINRLVATGEKNSLFPFPVKILTLKQFRDAQDTLAACYQAIVQSTISIDGLVDGGPLFDSQLGDPTGGIYIDVRDDDAQSIVQDFGIEVAERFQSDGCSISRLRPVGPFWSELDMSYKPANFQYWRSLASTWSATHDPKALTSELGEPNTLTKQSDQRPY